MSSLEKRREERGQRWGSHDRVESLIAFPALMNTNTQKLSGVDGLRGLAQHYCDQEGPSPSFPAP